MEFFLTRLKASYMPEWLISGQSPPPLARILLTALISLLLAALDLALLTVTGPVFGSANGTSTNLSTTLERALALMTLTMLLLIALITRPMLPVTSTTNATSIELTRGLAAGFPLMQLHDLV